MNDEELKQLLSRREGAPAEEARQRAVAAAMAAFDEEHAHEKTASQTQGNADSERLTPDRTSQGSKIMNLFTASSSPLQRWVYSGLASAAVLVLGVFITTQVPWQGGMDTPPVNETALKGGDATRAARDSALEEAVASAAPRIELQVEESSRAFSGSRANVVTPESSAPRPKLNSRAAADAATSRAEEVIVTGMKRAPAPAMAAAASPLEGIVAPGYQDSGRDRFTTADANPVKRVADEPVSTFSIDVDTAAYSFVRRMLNQGVLPQKAAVRVEEMINYFPYDYPLPTGREAPFSTTVSVLDSPWKTGNKLVHIGIQGFELQGAQPRSNLVFLLDVSGSMNSPDKLPLVKQSMALLLSRLQAEDTVSIVVYAGAAGTVLEPTPVKEKQKILDALNRLQAGGSTAGAAGIQLAYQVAESQFVEDGVNRVVLATDGDFNVGIHNPEELKGFVERKRDAGVYLSVLGFGQGNYHDALMQQLAQNGNGVAAYIDTLGEAQKVLVHEATSALFPIANDVKIQVEFNPQTVSEYRLLGYETRQLAEEDFNNDAVDAGDIGAGHSVTAIYEITPAGSDSAVYEPSRYREQAAAGSGKGSEYGFLKLRYKLPGEQDSKLISRPIRIDADPADAAQLREARFASAVAGFGELLRGGKYTADWNYSDALQLAQANRGDDPYGYRAELVQLIRKAEVAQAM
ncbi:vWA domain-containing protein [Parahaliea aestuarii]|uniref:VWA domain-containing protein n=1 Tax=Parahaliea aestuarii TaxID=1852021 RepID=A0A5C8ZN47_9GAMM|nr:VWA domain-containing protein [Parahaliea aestuarii]TXS89184.1 VWA domain-containing protein [Parahaliea aestuarii]